MKEEKSTFTVRSYTKSELAHLYNPQLTLKNATQVLRRWILHNAELHAELIHLGYQEPHFHAPPSKSNSRLPGRTLNLTLRKKPKVISCYRTHLLICNKIGKERKETS